MTRLILIRHGETDWSREKRYQGHSDIALSRAGGSNIRALIPQLKTLNVDVLYTSSLKRACQSSQIISTAIGIKPRVDSRLNELNFGEWEGKTAAQLIAQKDKSFLSWAKGKWATPIDGESIHSLRRRIRQFHRECLKKHANQTIAIVSHGGPIRTLILESLRLPHRFLFLFQVEPSSLSILTFHSDNSAQLSNLNVNGSSCHKTTS